MLISSQAERLIEGREYSFANAFYLRNGFSVIFTEVGCQHDHKLVASKASYSIALADTRDQARGDLLQQQVSPIMSEGVIE